MSSPSFPSPVQHGWMRRWLAPSVPDLLFLAIALWLIAYTLAGDVTGMGLLSDSQTGYHIRIGEYVLAHGSVPTTDFLSFTRPGEPFFAWEWLTGLGWAVLYQWGGLGLIVVISALILALTLLIMVHHMATQGANVILVIFLAHMAIGASSIHYLARPHIFTLLFLAAALYILHKDLEHPTPLVWCLAPLAALWANLHAGFFGLLVSLGILAAGSVAEGILIPRQRPVAFRRAWRWGLLTLACFAATLATPYGVQEHIHLIRFMRETWYLNLTHEYQAPNFLTSAGAYYGVLLAAGLAVAARLLWRGRIDFALLILAWAYASSRSTRHIPIYVIVVLPWIAAQAALLWASWTQGRSRKTLAGTLETIAADYQPALTRHRLFVPFISAVLVAGTLVIKPAWDFPDPLYPVTLVQRHAGRIEHARVFSTDSWGHYLTYRFPEPFRIYIDGRTDFFAERFSHEYLDTMNGAPGWQQTLKRYGVEMALIPPDIALAGRLSADPEWRLIERTGAAALFARN